MLGLTRWRLLAYFCLGCALWICATPYMGIDHDARLYVLMALRHLSPAAYVADPWFAWGSQDDWSLYSPLLAHVLVQFGVQQGALVMTFLQGIFFVFAALCLCRTWLPAPILVLAFLLLVSIPLVYAPQGMLTVSEGFVTARGLAVSLSMLALANLRTRPLATLFLHGLAMGMHPIMGLGPALVSLLIYPPRQVSVGLFGVGAFSVTALFAAALAGWVPLLEGEWFDYVEPAVLVFIIPWLKEEAARLAFVFLVLVLGALYGTRRARPLYAAVAIVGTGGLLVSLLTTQIPVLIVLQAQIWRTFWLCMVVVAMAFADLAIRHVLRQRAPWRCLWGLLGSGLFLLGYFINGLVAVLVAVFVGALLSRRTILRSTAKLAKILNGRQSWVGGFLVLLAVVFLPSFLVSLGLAASSVDAANGQMLLIEGLFRSGGFGLLALIAFVLVRWWSGTAILFMLVIAFLSQGYWDARSENLRDEETGYSVDGAKNPFFGWIKRGDVVYWHEHPERVWMELGTAGYASTTHCTGLVYSRPRTLVLKDRMLKVAAYGMDKITYENVQNSSNFREAALQQARPRQIVSPNVLASYEARAIATPHGIKQLCADPALDWVISTLAMEGAYVASVAMKPRENSMRWYLYDCRKLRD